MGSGEFDGGSSVKWQVIHSDGESGSGDYKGGNGKDKDPKKIDDAKFTVTITGTGLRDPIEPIVVPVKGTKISIVWQDPRETSS
jgi:hypothetical protein